MFKELPVEINELIFENLSVVELLIYSDNEIVKRIIKKNYNDKYISSIVKYPELLKYLINDVDKDIALCRSAEQGLIDNVRYLIKEGADVRRGQDFPLRYAVKNRHIEIVKLVIKDSWIDAEYGDALRSAVKNEDIDMVKYLVENGAYIDVFFGDPLHSAIYIGNWEITKFLIDNGADIHEREVARLAVHCGHTKIFEYLIKKGLIISKYNIDFFYYSIEYGNLEIVKIIVSMGLEPEDKERGIDFAIKYEQDNILEYLKNN